MNVSQFLVIALVAVGAFFIVDNQITGYFGGYSPLSETVTNCMDLATENEVYILTGNVEGNQSNGICFNILANNVTLDCDGYNITGDSSEIGTPTIGVYVEAYNNTTIQNCFVSNHTTGVLLNDSSYNILENNIIYNTSYGFSFYETEYTNIFNNTVNNNSFSGIYLENSTYNELIENGVYNNTFAGIYLVSDSDYNNLTNNTASYSDYGIVIYNASNNILLNNTVHDNDEYGILIESSSSFNELIENNVYYNPKTGIIVHDSYNNTFTSNNISSNNYGVLVESAFNNSFVDNTFFNNSVMGIHLNDSSSNNIIIENTLDANTFGVYLEGSSENNIENNTVFNNSHSGFFIAGNSDYNNLTNNTASYSDYGIVIYNASNNILLNNTVHDNDEYGIILNDNSDYNQLLENNAFENFKVGIFIALSSNNTLVNNTANKNGEYGIYFSSDSTDNELNYSNACENTLTDINDTDSNTFYQTTCDTSNPIGICVHACPVPGICECDSCATCTTALNDTLCAEVRLNQSITSLGTCIDNPENFSNKIFDCQGYTATGNESYDFIYLNNKTDNIVQNCVITNFSNGLHLYMNSEYNSLINNTIYNNTNHGIQLSLSSNNLIEDNTVYNNTNSGIVIYTSSNNNTLINNTVKDHAEYGFIFTASSENKISNCFAENNKFGIVVTGSVLNIIHCNITNNTVGIWANTSALNVHYNNLWNNANFSVQNVNSSMNVDASSNWWNTTIEPSKGATPPKNASLNVTVGDWLKAPVLLDTPVFVASPLNNSYTNGTINLNVFTNRNAICRYGTSPGSLTDMASTGGTNHTQTATASSEGERTYYFSCTNDIGLIHTNNTTIFVDLTPPVISSIKLDSITGTTIYISWTTNDDTTTKTYYRAATPPTTSPLGILNNTIPSTTHSANINHPLNSGTTYYVQVYAYDHVYNPTNTTIYRFVTENKTVPLFEILEVDGNSTNVSFINPKINFFIQANENTTGCEITASESTLKPFATAPNIAFTYLNITANPALESVLNWTYINYTYVESELNAREINASTLRMYRYNETTTSWQLIADSDVNTTGKYVWANVSEFSYFAVVGTLNNGAVCTSDSQCLSDNCAADYDGIGKWCAPETNCAHNSDVDILTNTYRCDPVNVNDSLKCSNGEWIRTTCSLGCNDSTGLCIVSSPINGGGTGGSGGAGATTTPSTSITFIWDIILSNAPAVAILTSDNISISKVTVNVTESVSGDISLKVAQFSAKPAAVTELEDVYAYLEVTPQNIPSSKISSVTIEFSVDTAWLNANGIPPENVVLQRYTTAWNPLQTNYLGNEGNKSLYSVTITGFSYFAITGSATDVPIIAPPETDDAEQPPVFEYCGDGICQSNEDCLTCPVDCGVCITQQETEPSNMMFYVIIIIAGVAAASIFAIVYLKFLRKGEPIEKPTSTQSYAPTYQYPTPIQGMQPHIPPDKEHQLDTYVNKMLQKGVPEENIRTALKKVGWNARTINKVMVLGKLPPEYLERAENYANVMIQNGVSKEIIKQRLMAKRWPEDIVNQILNK